MTFWIIYIIGFLVIPTTPFWIPWVHGKMMHFRNEVIHDWSDFDSFMSFLSLVAWPFTLPMVLCIFISKGAVKAYGEKFNNIGKDDET